ncbi:MAG: hypothetical protein IKX54_02740 [Lachnospiraceae bacterium]|nr:hypothetical protein [Lachnospiraceae bacterium]
MISLFYPGESLAYEQVKTLPEPAYFRDLNIGQYVDAFAERFEAKELKPYFYCFSGSYETAKYRQEIVRDLTTPAIRDAIERFENGILEAVNCAKCSQKVIENIQKYKWNVDCVHTYYLAMEELCVAFNTTPPKSKAFYELHQELYHILNTSAVRRLRQSAKLLNEEFAKMRFQLCINKEKATFEYTYDPNDYCMPIRNALAHSADNTDYVPFRELPFPSIDIAPLEAFIIARLVKENRQLFLQMETFGKNCENVISQDVLDILKELRFYRYNIEFFDDLKQKGMPTVMPLLVKDKELYMDDCYDVALALRNLAAKREVVLNDIMKANYEKAIIVTGPNQGGKTTLGRAFGQCFYFGMMGLYVPAGVCKLPYISGIYTHFANEEGAEGVDGRLVNELQRIREMLQVIDNRGLVILNELFTSAPTVDALAMSRDLLKRLIANNAICFCVTHTYEIALDSDDYVSLVATVVEDGSFRRTYRIIRKAADGIAYADSIVSKYKLDYSHINYRLHRK